MSPTLIIVTNRLPFRIEKKGNSYEIKQSSGGLVTALQSVKTQHFKLKWIGVADFKKEVWDSVSHKLQSTTVEICPLFVDKKKYHKYYNGFSNTTIWPLFHYFPSFAEYDETCFDAYKEINEEFATQINAIAQYGDYVWIHDYHLMLLPHYLKKIRKDIRTGFFLHIPFPSYEIIKLIPNWWRSQILDSLRTLDVVGFHTREYMNHYLRSLRFFQSNKSSDNFPSTGSNGSIIKAYPIGVDFEKLNKAYDLPAVKRGRNLIREKQKNRKIIFSVDRLDYTKGVINRLEAYESLLEKNAEWHGKVVFVINVVPSRDQISKYAERKKMIEENVGRINGLYGNFNWQPIIYQYRHLTFNQLISFYTVADVALVTPLRDGMNLVAKEFAASRKDKKGVLILSEFAGAASELKEAILINPNDIEAIRLGLIKALNMDEEEQKIRITKMQDKLRDNDIEKWTDTFINDLTAGNVKQSTNTAHNDL